MVKPVRIFQNSKLFGTTHKSQTLTKKDCFTATAKIKFSMPSKKEEIHLLLCKNPFLMERPIVKTGGKNIYFQTLLLW